MHHAIPRGWRTEWRRFGVWDYVGTAATIGAFYLVEAHHNPRRSNWTEPLPLDRPVRDALVARTAWGRERADTASDYFWFGSVALPVLDVAIATPLVHRDARMTYELSLMNLQAFAAVSLWMRGLHKAVGRSRPNTVGCAEEGPDYSYQCGSDFQFMSFPGGHVGVSMTGAGLVCAHHLQGHLYRHRFADGAACGAAVTLAGTVGWLRLTADKHWLSDTMFAAGLGFLTGYGLPTFLYYRPFWRGFQRRRFDTAPRNASLPLLGAVMAPLPGGFGGMLHGRF